MDSIADQLGISKRTIYEVFSDKDELFTRVLGLDGRKAKGISEKSFWMRSENTIVAIFRLLEINRDHFQSMSPAFQDDLKKFHKEVLIKKSDECEMPDFRNNQLVIERGIKEKYFQ